MEGLIKEVEKVRNDFQIEIQGVANPAELEVIRVKYVGKKGIIGEFMKKLKELPSENRKDAGASINSLKEYVESTIAEKQRRFAEEEEKKLLEKERVDISLPGVWPRPGHLHPITLVTRKIVDIFWRMGFEIAEGPEVETDFLNFEALNIPRWHPARDMQDSFFFSNDVLLRTHTSPVQIRTMLQYEPPLKMICFGKVYRVDEVDASHNPMFHQLEGLVVDKKITFSDLKGTLALFAKELFGRKRKVVFRPSYFPFTEPSAEVDVECVFCDGKGCRVCKRSGFIEIMGAGMVNPKVFENCSYDPGVYNGFAFGMGIDRITLLMYDIDDIRHLFTNDMRFLEQF